MLSAVLQVIVDLVSLGLPVFGVATQHQRPGVHLYRGMVVARPLLARSVDVQAPRVLHESLTSLSARA